MDSGSVLLAFFAFSRKVLAIFNHRWPIGSVAFDFDFEGSSTRVISVGSRMDLFHFPSRFLPFYAGHEWSGKSPLVEFFVNQDIWCGLGFNFLGFQFFCWDFLVGDVRKDCLCPGFFESVLGLIGILACLEIDFLGVPVW